MKNTIYLAIGIIIIAGSLYLFAKNPVGTNVDSPRSLDFQNIAQTMVKMGETEIRVELADTTEKRNKGLSGRASLGWGEGMLFIFDKTGIYSIWMKDMNFPIDIAWIDEGGKVIWIEKRVDPETYPKSFASPTPAKFVLEVSSGFFEANGIEIGQHLSGQN